MKHLKSFLFAAFAALFTFTSCGDDDSNEIIIDPVFNSQVIILNNGNWGSNDANLLRYDLVRDQTLPEAFYEANGQRLGDLGQDIAIVGNDLYIAVNGSQCIFVTDRSFKIKKRIEAYEGETKLSPRYFCVTDQKVYVTYYEGFLGEIDRSTYAVRTTPVGPNPEGLVLVDGKMYVANSGGYLAPAYDNTISVVDLTSFQENKRITVNTNPQMIVAHPVSKTLYVNSFGNYDDIPAKLQRIDLTTEKVTDLDQYQDVKAICSGAPDYPDFLFVATGSYDENWQVTANVHLYNMQNNNEESVFKDTFTNFYSLSYDKGLVFIGCSDYKTNGDMYLYDTDGILLKKFDSQGLNPIKGIRF